MERLKIVMESGGWFKGLKLELLFKGLNDK